MINGKPTIEIPTDLLKAATLFAAKSTDVRLNFNAVWIEWRRRNVGIISTDGHRLFAGHFELPVPDDECEPGSATIELSQVKIALTGYKGDTISFSFDPGTLKGTLGKLEVVGMDCDVPAWRNVVPKTVSGEVAHYNPSYVGDLAKASKVLLPKGGAESTVTHQNGQKPALVTFGSRGDVVAVLMPCRHKFDYDRTNSIAQSIAA